MRHSDFYYLPKHKFNEILLIQQIKTKSKLFLCCYSEIKIVGT